MALEGDLLNIGGIRDRGTIVNLGLYWRDVRMEYSGGNITYKGAHYKHNPLTSDGEWLIVKYTWSGTDLVRIETLVGSWDNRATLDWG